MTSKYEALPHSGVLITGVFMDKGFTPKCGGETGDLTVIENCLEDGLPVPSKFKKPVDPYAQEE